MKGPVVPYAQNLLPDGFRYPESYLQLSHSTDIPNGLMWDFPGPEYDHAVSEWNFRNHWKAEGWLYLEGIDPIPFARNGDWAAFFDGGDRSGDPEVVVIDLGNKINSYRLKNFNAWFDRALQDSGLK